MKQSLLTTSLVFCVLSCLTAQITLDSGYFPAPGDSLKIAVDESPVGVVITAPGGGQDWDLSEVQADVAYTQTVAGSETGEGSGTFAGADLLINLPSGAESYYRSSDTEFANIGYYGEDPLGQGIQVAAGLSPAYVERWAPLAFFGLHDHDAALNIVIPADQIPGDLFSGLPIAPDSVKVALNTERTDLVDAWGTMTIPGGTYAVLREKRIEYREVTVEARATFTPWIDVTDFIVELLPIDELGSDTLVSYYFWSDEAKEPIAVIRSDASGNEVTAVEFKNNGVISSAAPVVALKPSVNVYPNPAINQARFSFSNLPAGDYRLELFNLTGSSVWSRQYTINGDRSVPVDLSGLRKGLYLYAVQDSDGRRLAVNRLVIMRP